MLTTTEIRKLQPDEIKAEIVNTQSQISRQKLDLSNGNKQTHLLKSMRAYIARLKTVLNEKSLS